MAREGMLVLGAGGHSRVVADLIRACGHRVVGFVDPDETKLGRPVGRTGAAVVATVEGLLDQIERGGALPAHATAVVPGVGLNGVRLREAMRLRELLAPALVHPAATVSPSAAIGSGSVVMPGALVNADAEIGQAVILNSGSVIEHDCSLADGVHVSPGAVLNGAVIVGARAWIGAGAVVLPRIRVGADATVGAGSVVLADVASDSTVGGNPARPLLS